MSPDVSDPLFDDICASDQQLHIDTDGAMSSQHSTSPPCALRHSHRSCSPAGSDKGSDARLTPDHTHPLTELELLHQECQEKEALINKLSEQLADCGELRSQLQEKDRLNHQYVEALQAAESTIAYLTACSLDSQGQHVSRSRSGPDPLASDATLFRRCTQLHKALQEKERVNNDLAELLNASEKFITSSFCHQKNPDVSDLCFKIDMALQQVRASPDLHNLKGDFGTTETLPRDLKHPSECQQDAPWELRRPSARVQVEQGAEGAFSTGDHRIKSLRQIAEESLQENEQKINQLEVRDFNDVSLNPKMSEAVLKFLRAIEAAVASLAEHCTDVSAPSSARSSQTSSDLQDNLDKLQRALQESNDLRETSLFSDSCGPKGHSELHNNLCHLYKVFLGKCQRISELQASLQEEKGRREDHSDHRTVPEVKGLPPSVKMELETLHKALRDKKKACKSLEERLATALTNAPVPEAAQKGTKASFVM